MSDSSQVSLNEVKPEKIDSAFESDSDAEKGRKDAAAKEKEHSKRTVEQSVLINSNNSDKGKILRVQLLKLDAYARHKKFINDYVLYYNGSTSLLQRDTSGDRTDLDVIRENHRFLWSTEDDTDTWGKRIAKKYYDKLFKEYAIADLSRYRENKIALRWRVEKEVVDGKGQFSCGNKSCSEKEGLRSWEVNFAYMEDGGKKNALVKLRMCPECSYRLNYYHQKKEVNAKRKSKHSSKKRGEIPPKKMMKTGEFSRSESTESNSNVQDSPDGSLIDAKADETESVLWKGPVQVEDKSKEDEFDDYFEDLFL